MNELQKVDVEILKAVVNVCDTHDLTYYAMGGTLLGAVRHKGFIPWDDDIDIALSRPDYDKLLDFFRTELSSDYVVQNFHTSRDQVNPTYLSRIGKRGTLVSYGVANESVKMPIWIDVFPLDAMPTNRCLRFYQKYRLLFQRCKYQFSTYETNAHQHKSHRPLHEKALMRFREITKLGSNWDPVEVLEETERIARRYDYATEEYLVNLFGAYKFREMFPKSWFAEGVDLPFEDTEIHCPVEYHKVLTQMYGDYMVPPSEAEKINHHCVTVISTGDNQESVEERSKK